jgi:glycerol-3-phosphate O-acyltransferase
MNNFLKKPSDTSCSYSCGLPYRLGWVRHLILKLMFSRIHINDEQIKVIKNLPPDALMIYTNKTKNKFECLFFYFQCIRYGLSAPRIAFDYRFYFWQPWGQLLEMIRNKFLALKQRSPLPDAYASGFIRNKLLNYGAGFLSLAGKTGFFKRWVGVAMDPMEYLIVLQKEISRPIFLIPHLLFFDNKPIGNEQNLTDILFGSKQKPGHLRRILALFRRPKDIFVEISEPLNLKYFLKIRSIETSSDEVLAVDLRRRLLEQINGHRQRVTGPSIKSAEELRQTVLTSADLTRYIQRHSARRKITLFEARKEASKYFNEIAAKYSLSFVALGSAVTRWFLKSIFDKVTVDMDGLNRIKRKHLKGPLVFIPCHKSNFDSITLMSVLYANHLHCPHTFAGENLSFWPIGPFLRRTGAFFMRRSFKGAVFYAVVFSEYVKILLKEGYNMEIFIEGTRSRSGKLLPPQVGGLSLLINAYQNNVCPDLVFVPVSISYDRIPEESSYLHEIQGGQKTKESLGAMIKGGKILKSRYGQIYFHFADPVVLSSFFEMENVDISETLKGKKLNRFSKKLGQRLLYEVQCKSVITPQSLVAAALLGITRQNITAENVFEIVETFLSYLSTKNIFLTDPLTIDPPTAVAHALKYFTRRNIIEPVETMSPKDQFKIPLNKRNSLEFHKNNAIGHLIPAAFTALLILTTDMFQFGSNHLHSEYAYLKKLFVNEFFFDPDQTIAYQVRKTIKAFIDDLIVIPHPTLPDTYNLTSPGYRKLQSFSGLLKPLFEAYLVALSYYRNLPEKLPSKKERVRAMRSSGHLMRKKNQIDRVEAISEVYLSQADAVFSHMGFQKKDTFHKSEHEFKRIQTYLKYLS